MQYFIIYFKLLLYANSITFIHFEIIIVSALSSYYGQIQTIDFTMSRCLYRTWIVMEDSGLHSQAKQFITQPLSWIVMKAFFVTLFDNLQTYLQRNLGNKRLTLHYNCWHFRVKLQTRMSPQVGSEAWRMDPLHPSPSLYLSLPHTVTLPLPARPYRILQWRITLRYTCHLWQLCCPAWVQCCHSAS